MSTPDAKLSAAERAALAELEAAAAAADPRLASVLRGGAVRRRFRSDLRLLRSGAAHAAAVVMGARWWGAPITVVGLFLTVFGLSSGIVISFAGAVMAAVGLAVLLQMAQLRLARVGRGDRTG